MLSFQDVQNVITLEYDMESDCVFYGDVQKAKIFMQCLNGSLAHVLVDNARSVEGKLGYADDTMVVLLQICPHNRIFVC